MKYIRHTYNEDANIKSSFNMIVDAINELIKSVNNYNAIKDNQGAIGDIRVTEEGLQYRTKRGWITVEDNQ